MKLSEMNVILTDKDLLLFIYLFETDFLTRQQIYTYIYSEYKSYSRTRIWQLTRNRYLKKIAHPLGKEHETLIMADKKALDALKLHKLELKTLKRKDTFKLSIYNPEEDYSVQTGLTMGTLSHDICLNELRFLLENAGANFYRTHKMINREKFLPFTPDAIFEKRQKAYALELEIARKDIDRYKDIFNRYAAENSVDYVLYLLDNNKVYNRVANLINQKIINYSIDGYKKFYIAKLDEFLSGNWVFINPANDQLKFNLKEVLK